jgi:UDP-N-acetylglucosamine 2-epimerase (hydrolysing)
MKKKILFLTSTRADFGKLKSLMIATKLKTSHKVYIVVTGMHMLKEYGYTFSEVNKSFKSNIIKFNNQKSGDKLEIIFNKTVDKFSKIIKKLKPDLIIVHGDRVEAMACALVGSLNHILTGHVEGGEISGTIDDTIRHALTKLSHIHFVGTPKARKRIIRMGELKKSIFTIGSPDSDFLMKKKHTNIEFVKKRYEINFNKYALFLWHPVTSQIKSLKKETKKVLKFLKKYPQNFVVIYPNNDPGNKIILNNYKKISKNKKFKIIKSMRFEYFISLLKGAEFIIGNSSSALYEAPTLGVPAINLGDRQRNRLNTKLIKNLKVNNLTNQTVKKFLNKYSPKKINYYGSGDSDKKFTKAILQKTFWKISSQKFFSDQ